VEVVKGLFRVIAFLFHLLLTLFLLALSTLAFASGAPNLHLGMLPWSGATLVHVLLFSSIFGLITVILAWRKLLRPLFFLWALAVAILLLRGYLLTGYRFGPGEWRTAVWLMVFSWLSVVGAWFQMRAGTRGVKRRY
jgi:hypothetical protein